MESNHVVAIIGGAVAGSEAANQLTQKGIPCVVFEQNALPYGKMEIGLPKWHFKLRDRQEKIINEKLSHPMVDFVPKVKLGRELDIHDLIENWKFSAVLLAIGAWRDRPLPIEGIDAYWNKGLLYQSQITQWFNHCHDPNYRGPQYTIPYRNVAVIGGGLASLDIMKILLIRQILQRLTEMGITYDALRLEKFGVPQSLEKLGLTWEDLNIEAPTLYVRSPLEDMPLVPLPDNATEAQIAKANETKRKMMAKLQEKFPFRLVTSRQAVDFQVKDGHLAAVVFARTEEKEPGVFETIPGTEEEIPVELLVGSIGAIPEPLPGIPMKGEIFDVVDFQSGKINHFANVFALGNAVTGRGNIRQSMLHSKQVTETIVDNYLSLDDEDYAKIFDARNEQAEKRVNFILQSIQEQKPLSGEEIQAIKEKVAALQKQVGYDGDYARWIETHLPARLEKMVDFE